MQSQRGESSSHAIEERVGLLAKCEPDEEFIEMDDLKREYMDWTSEHVSYDDD